MTEMTIIEGLKKLKRIDRRISKNALEIEKYSSIMSNEKPYFSSEAEQMQEVKQLVQSTLDLEKEYCKLKRTIDYTNLVVMVSIDDETRSIHDWLTVVRKTGRLIIDTYRALNSKTAESHRSRGFSNSRDKDSPAAHVVRLYDENMKREGERKWEDLTTGHVIEGRLEVINATTKLISPPEE